MNDKKTHKRDIYVGREISWLRFNERVLLQADADEVPLLERLRFLAIFTSNLDEFFMVRAGSLHDRALLPNVPPDNKTGLTAAEQLCELYREARRLYTLRDEVFERLTRRLSECGVVRCEWSGLTKEEKKQARQFFKKEIAPLATPYIIDSKHPFPHLENRVPHILLSLRDGGGKPLFGIIPEPKAAAKLITFQNTESLRYMTTAELLLHEADELFKSYTVKSKLIVKITRNADIEIDDNFSDDPDHELDYKIYLKILLKKREKLGAVRLEYLAPKRGDVSRATEFLSRRLGITEEQIYRSVSPLSYDFAAALIKAASVFIGEHTYRQVPPIPAALGDIYKLIRSRDILLSYPYHSMRTYLEFLRTAVFDDNVQSIRITLYRLSEHSEIISLLRTAAENGKSVTAVVELKARFDEESNICSAQLLEDSGCHVIYGMNGLKVHSKVTLITRKEGDAIESFAHIATGNYNEQTAKQYTDIGILTADRALNEDVAELFRSLTSGVPSEDYRHLLVSPTTLKPRILAEIARERDKALSGRRGYICMKMNSMTDKEVIDALAEASRAGAVAELIIRGICCLKAGVPDETENIRVISIVGRFLEHSRIFIFGDNNASTADEPPRVYIGSADMMTRNTSRRIEVITPILDRKLADTLCEVCCIELCDNVKASEMLPDGTYKKIESHGEPHDSQMELYSLYKDRRDN